jgi:hypothetical protein
MVRAIQSIERDLAALQSLVGAIADEFYTTYQEYLQSLGQAMRQQLILASYYLCTQGYPEKFLQLSLSQRQHLQQSLQRMARDAQQHLTEGLLSLEESRRQNQGATPPHSLQASPTANGSNESMDEAIAPSEAFPPETSHPNPDSILAIAGITPHDVAEWQGKIEARISTQLQLLSHHTNQLLQEIGLLSGKLPEPILEVASKADMVAEATLGPPNLLKLQVVTEGEEEEELEATHLMVVHLRLSEIEFSDPTLAPKRAKIRELSSRLQQLGRDFRKKQREKAIAEAEAAWRSSWFES